MLSNGYSYYPHYGPAGIARRGLRSDSARSWPAPAISLFFLFRAAAARKGVIPRPATQRVIAFLGRRVLTTSNGNGAGLTSGNTQTAAEQARRQALMVEQGKVACRRYVP